MTYSFFFLSHIYKQEKPSNPKIGLLELDPKEYIQRMPK